MGKALKAKTNQFVANGLVASATDVEERIDRHDRIDTDVTEPASKDCPVVIGGRRRWTSGTESFGSSSRRPLSKAQAKTELAFVAHSLSLGQAHRLVYSLAIMPELEPTL
jgi:hypothetical protein